MSMKRIAQLAGVSTSTVSRVFHEVPGVRADTAATVREVMGKLGFISAVRKRPHRRNGSGNCYDVSAGTIAFLVVGTTGSSATPAFENLLRGVSDAVNLNGLNLILSFISDPAQIPHRLLDERKVVGVLCHGDQPGGRELAHLRKLPTVWLMANRDRPQWGDQVMPNNAVIGATAGGYLIRRGHRCLAYVGLQCEGWCMGLRSFTFVKAAEDAETMAHILEAPAGDHGSDYWRGGGLTSAAEAIVRQIVGTTPMPTGLFIAEDRLLPEIDRALRARGIRPGTEIEVISCNNEQPHYVGLAAQPARIDIRAEVIGRLGVEQLLWRVTNGLDVAERIRVMVDPVLIEPHDRAPSNNCNRNGNETPQRASHKPAHRSSAEVEVEVTSA